MPRFSILHTSARPDKWREIYNAWILAADRPEDVEYVLVVDERWGFTNENCAHQEGCGFWTPRANKLIWNTGRRCYVEGVNLAAKHSTGDILIVIADDQYPCEHWDTELMKAGPRGDWCEALLHVATGTPDEFTRQITPMPIMSRSLYRKWGYVFYPEYESMYADNDLCEHAKQDGVLIEARHLFFPHKHAAFDDNGKFKNVELDDAYRAQNRAEAYENGRAILQRRRTQHFCEDKPIASAERGQHICVCLPGESFHHSWVRHFIELNTHLNKRFPRVSILTGYASQSYCTRAMMLKAMREMEHKPDLVLWIDDDNLLKPEQLDMLIADLEEHSVISGIAAWCWCHEGEGQEMRLSCGAFNTDGSCEPISEQQLMSGEHDIWPIGFTGFPVFLQRFSMFEKLGFAPFAPIPTDKHFIGALGEDISFCKRSLDAGLMLAVDRRVRVPHLKLRENGPQRVFAETPAKPATQLLPELVSA